MRIRRFVVLFVLALTLISPLCAAESSEFTTVVWCRGGDAYAALAQQIADEEDLLLVTSLDQALAYQPEYIIWVVDPDTLSEEDFIEVRQSVREAEQVVALGLITGNTLEDAQALWQRRSACGEGPIYRVYGSDSESHCEFGSIIAEDGMMASLDSDSLTVALGNASYLSYVGHGGPSYWGLHVYSCSSYSADQVPQLDACLIGTSACETTVFWSAWKSIALTMIERGAAAYTGFATSPNSGYVPGVFEAAPFAYTWPGVTVGQVVALQNQAAEQGYATTGLAIMLGDPRLVLSDTAPYVVQEDTTLEDGTRLVRLSGVPSGVALIRLEDAAEYEYVSVEDYTAVREGQSYYNADLQTAVVGTDRLVLVVQDGGELTLHLSKRVPIAQTVFRTLRDGLDHTLIYLNDTGTPLASIVLSIAALLIGLLRLRRFPLTRRQLLATLLVGLVLGGGHALYILLRLGEVTITSKPLAFSFIGPLASALLGWCGAVLYLASCKAGGRLAGVLVASAWPLAQGFGVAMLMLLARVLSGEPFLVNTASIELSLIAWGCVLPGITLLLWGTGKLARKRFEPNGGI